MSAQRTSGRLAQTMKFIVCGLTALSVLAGCTELRERRTSAYPELGGPGLSSNDDAVGTPTRLTGATQVSSATTFGGSSLQTAELYRGSGVLVQPIAANGPGVITANGGVTLNFVDADIRDVVAAILGETLGLNYEIDPRVQGSVTVRTARPLPHAAVLQTLEEILASRGAALVRSDTVNRVVPIEEAVTSVSTAGFRSSIERVDKGFGLYFFPLDFTTASSLINVLEAFVPPGRLLRADDERNLLIFSGTSLEAQDFESLVATFDIDRMAGMSFGLYPVRFADLPSLLNELRTVFGADGEGGGSGVVRFLPVDRLNAVLVITSQPDYLDDVQTWVTRLDRGEEGVGRQIFVYRVQNGRAADMAEVLGQVFAVSGTADEALSDALAPGLEPVELTRGPDSAEVVAEGDPAGQPYAGPRPASAAVIGAGDTGIGIPFAGVATDIRIVPDTRNNALLIWSTPAEYRMILSTIRELDVIPLQTLIEATIVEVTLRDNLEYGLQWFFRAGDNNFTFSTAPDGSINSSFPGFSYFLSGTDVQVVLNALTEISDVKVISSPSLLVLDNEAAVLQVGDEVPIAVQQSQQTAGADAPVVSSIEYRQTGVILEVTPRVNAGGLVTLDIVQEVSTVSQTTSSTLNSPTISQRRIESSVAVQGGESIALGGLISDTRTDIVVGVPLLSSIPVLGNLFKTTTDKIERTELLVLLTPRVVRDLQDARDVTEELRERLSGLDEVMGTDSKG